MPVSQTYNQECSSFPESAAGEFLLVSGGQEAREGDAVVIARPFVGPNVSPVCWTCGFLRGSDLHDSKGLCFAGFAARGFAVQGVVVSVVVE